jgi:hypothetical protein
LIFIIISPKERMSQIKRMFTEVRHFKIGLLNKKRGNFKLQEKFAGSNTVVDETCKEVTHHRHALIDSGYDVCTSSPTCFD